MDKLEAAIANPFVRILLTVGVLFALFSPTVGMLQTLMLQLGIFEDFFLFDRWWNLPPLSWFVVLGLAAGWVAGGLSLKFDPPTVLIGAGLFVFWALIINNILGDVPGFVRTLLVVLRALITIGGVMVGGLGLVRAIEKGKPLTAASFGPVADAMRPPASPGEGTTPTPAPAPGQTGTPAAAGNPAAGWFPDPKQEANLRYWDGSQWTDHTN